MIFIQVIHDEWAVMIITSSAVKSNMMMMMIMN
jgi:hypothetical protein